MKKITKIGNDLLVIWFSGRTRARTGFSKSVELFAEVFQATLTDSGNDLDMISKSH